MKGNVSLNMFSGITKRWRYVVSFVIAWVLLVQFIPACFNDSNSIYAIGEIHTFDKSLFNSNVYLGGG